MPEGTRVVFWCLAGIAALRPPAPQRRAGHAPARMTQVRHRQCSKGPGLLNQAKRVALQELPGASLKHIIL